jgi:hypothetical protein
MKYFLLAFKLIFVLAASAQYGYWQQHVDYHMDIVMDTENHRFTGTQKLVYTNHSLDTLTRVFYHLYFNAFQPGSMMDVRSANIQDPDRRIAGKIARLKPDEIGYHKITMLTQDGEPLRYDVIGTVLEARLTKPIFPGQSTTFDMAFTSQVPVQIRRSGRNNKEDIDYTMTQWYPKLAEYDNEGWHPYQYIGREFYGVWGDFDVKITMPSSYVIGGTGVLRNPDQVGHGYADEPLEVQDSLTWHFEAKNVHDFAWAADPEFLHDRFTLQDGTEIHLLYHQKTANIANWKRAKPEIEKFFLFMNAKFGQYAYPQFSLIQGGDGGMEYPMCTMMLGSGKKYKGFIGLFVHEAAHSWFYGMLGTNEQRHHWMDEGFTSFAEEEAMNFMFEQNNENPHLSSFGRYALLDSLGALEPMSTQADHFDFNYAYATAAYTMGELTLMQLQYIMGDEAFWNGMNMYFNRWKFKHPKPEDFIKTMEDACGMELDWFLVSWTQLTKATDYAIDKVEVAGPSGGTVITLQNRGRRAMPVDVMVTLKDGSHEYYTIPLVSMYGHKQEEPYLHKPPWPWTHPEYVLRIGTRFDNIDSITIDPLQRSCDVNSRNNHWVMD